MKVHIFRVQGPHDRYWWIQSEKEGIHIKSTESLDYALRLFEYKFKCQITEQIKYKGIGNPAEVAMSMIDIIK